ncbi:Metallo-dependent phosphatase [Trametes cingulata]|nr:Metallo-dependent phosphatase [Trametes cingulata]
MRGTAASYHHSRTTYTVLSLFVVAVLVLGFINEPLLVSRVQTVSLNLQELTLKKKKDKFPFPDFDRYRHTLTLSPEEFGLEHPDERAIIVGDTHGMNRSLHNLLSTLSYDPRKDTLFLAGDLLAKSSEAGSLAILDFLSQRQEGICFPDIEPKRPEKASVSGARTQSRCKGVYAVRGNHDQMIVQWRAWRDWFEPLQLTFPSANLYPRRFSVPSFPSVTESATFDAGPPVGTGSQFLALIESEWLRDRTADPSGSASDPQEWVDTARKRAVGTWRAEWWKRIPQPGRGRAKKDWIMFGDHYWIARDMKPEHARFLFSLPLVIHVPSEHFFLVHGGLLPSDPRRPSDDARQPLAHPPSPDDIRRGPTDDADYEYPLLQLDPPQDILRNPSGSRNISDEEIEELRAVQERSILQDVPQNRDPWVVLNMRGVRKSGKVTRRSDKGKPWSKIWNGQMKRCAGFKDDIALVDSSVEDDDQEDELDRSITRFRAAEGREKDKDKEEEDSPLPCYPSTVVYGHAASRDLDVRRWTVGLDTGCLYGRRLTSLVLQRAHAKSQGPTRTSPTDDEEAEDEDEDESSDEEEDELDEYASDGPFGGVNSRFARVAGGSAVSRTRKPKTWTRPIRFGDKDSDLEAKLVSVKCPKAGDFAGP